MLLLEHILCENNKQLLHYHLIGSMQHTFRNTHSINHAYKHKINTFCLLCFWKNGLALCGPFNEWRRWMKVVSGACCRQAQRILQSWDSLMNGWLFRSKAGRFTEMVQGDVKMPHARSFWRKRGKWLTLLPAEAAKLNDTFFLLWLAFILHYLLMRIYAKAYLDKLFRFPFFTSLFILLFILYAFV